MKISRENDLLQQCITFKKCNSLVARYLDKWVFFKVIIKL